MPSGVFTLKQVDLAITQGAWTNQPPISVNYLVVAGGASGASNRGAGGGGAGGLLQGTFGITAGTSYTVTVGGGGAGVSSSTLGNSGSNSVFGPITATGGGGGSSNAISAPFNGLSGGSGGGAGGGAGSGGVGGQGVFGQGNAGGAVTGNATTLNQEGGAGGGGAGTVGLTATVTATGANGGAGVASDISGTRTTYAGGGGGAGNNAGGGAGVGGAGGAGGGGAGRGGSEGNGNATSGSANSGGGGGAHPSQSITGSSGAGGSGVVIVSYPGTTQWFTGGTLSYGNGNIVHSFYSSGTLAPTTPSTYVDTGYQISRSLRFNSADSAYLNRTPASAGNRKTWTWSGWIKRSLNDAYFFTTTNADINNATYIFITGDTLRYWDNVGAGGTGILQTTAVFRDFSAWYHIVLAVDTTQATASNRARLYVNGVQVTAFSLANYPNQNTDTYTNATVTHYIASGSVYFNGYMTEVNFIDGQALTPQSFGYYNPDTGVWSPLKFVGTYGTNGFYLNFSDNSNTTAATLGKDYSGNGNNWTPNNFSVTAGAGNDSLVDTPTPYGSDTGAGGEVRGNYCTLNPLFKVGAGTPSYANGNLDMTAGGTGDSYFAGTTVLTAGKWYYEATITSVGTGGTSILIGVCRVTDSQVTALNIGSYRSTSEITNLDGTTQTAGATYTTNDVIGVAIDIDNGTVKFYKNNVGQGATNSFTFTAGTPLIVRGRSDGANPTATFNFGQRAFAYTAPSGFKALCTQNLPTPTIGATTATQAGKYFNPVLYTGNGSTQSVTGVGFQPDLVWNKQRSSSVGNNWLNDAVRGAGNSLSSNSTSAESAYSAYFTSFGSDGFSLAGGTDGFNASGSTYVSWNWKANGAGSSNTAGSITSTVSANTTSGFSIVTYTGTGANATVGHGLGVAPSMIIQKNRTGFSWRVYHISTGNGNELYLDTTAAATSASTWNNTTPTSTVFSIGSGSAINGGGNACVAYCFAAVPGFSAFGSYTGNGSTDGPFVYTGFRPAYVMFKRTDVANDWVINDATRSVYNQTANVLYANVSDAENTTGTGSSIDILSNGFKLRQTNQGSNANGGTYIFMAFATSPFKYSLAR